MSPSCPDPFKMVLFIRINKATDAKIEKGICFFTIELSTLKEEKRAVIPKISNILEILEPTMLPIPISELPLIEEMILTINSGADVPNAITVNPITTLDIPNLLAMDEDPSTKTSAPLTRRTKPISNKKMFKSIIKKINKKNIKYKEIIYTNLIIP